MSLCSKNEFKYHSFTFTFVPSLKSLSFDYTIKNELYTTYSANVHIQELFRNM